MTTHPVAFMSYVRDDDEHDKGYLSEFRKRLSGEVYAHTGKIFHIFQDRGDIAWGENWRSRIDDTIDSGTFLICVITPRFFESDSCRYELERFLMRENELNRRDLVLPLYYIPVQALDEQGTLAKDELVRLIAQRQYVDWRELRYESLDSPQARKMLARIACDISRALRKRFGGDGSFQVCEEVAAYGWAGADVSSAPSLDEPAFIQHRR